jgi:formate hydrogenlyase subunit 6/NADH:ubiquinone oxidoreductase subunit I
MCRGVYREIYRRNSCGMSEYRGANLADVARAARYIGQSFIITLSHTNCLPITIHYPYEKSITSERFRG